MQDRRVRLLRACVVSVVVLALSLTAHVVGGGALPHPGVLLGLAAVTLLAATLSSGRAFKLPALMAVLGGGQLVLHHAFGLLSTGAACTQNPARPHHAMEHGVVSCLPVPLEVHESPVGGVVGAAMLAAHMMATLLTAAVLTRGEEALEATAAWLRPLLALPRPAALPPLRRIAVLVYEYRLVAAPFLVSPPLRGPPAFH